MSRHPNGRRRVTGLVIAERDRAGRERAIADPHAGDTRSHGSRWRALERVAAGDDDPRKNGRRPRPARRLQPVLPCWQRGHRTFRPDAEAATANSRPSGSSRAGRAIKSRDLVLRPAKVLCLPLPLGIGIPAELPESHRRPILNLTGTRRRIL